MGDLSPYRRCTLCEHRCGVNRLAGGRGICGADATPRVFQYGVEYGEERDLLPCNVIYLGGCDLRCRFCISAEQSFAALEGEELTGELLGRIIEEGNAAGAKTVQFSGGQPSIHIPAIARLLRSAGPLPLVWKTNLHETTEALEMIDPYVQVYLADLKFGNDSCAKRLSGAVEYMAIALRNLRWMALRRRTIIRHLALPGHGECCRRPILQLLARYLPDIELSIRDGYLPAWRALQHPDLRRAIEAGEARPMLEGARQAGLKVVS